jgi:hypothetical protein
METINLKLVGITPLLMHSDRFANPLDAGAKAHKVLTSKRNKTDDDHEAIAKSEWLGSLYFDKKIGPYIPTSNIRSCLVEGGKLRKLGKAIQRGTLILENQSALHYIGSRDPDEMVLDNKFIDCRSVVISGKRLMRYRPIFREWELYVSIQFDSAVIDAQQLGQAMSDAGRLIGIGDFRPNKGGSYGRFEVKQL